jgi:hypothetical protein
MILIYFLNILYEQREILQTFLRHSALCSINKVEFELMSVKSVMIIHESRQQVKALACKSKVLVLVKVQAFAPLYMNKKRSEKLMHHMSNISLETGCIESGFETLNSK